MESRSITVQGVPMRWEEHGAGPPVVLVHGIPTSPRLWRHVVPRLPGVRSLAWELVGYGASIPAGRGRDISVARQADYLAAWMREIGLEHAVLVGHDLGGGIVQIVAARYPELTRGLVLMNAIAYDSWPIPSIKALRALSPLVERLPLAAFRALFVQFIAQGHDARVCARESVAEHWAYYAATDGVAAFARQVRALKTEDTRAVAGHLPHLGVPARLVWGTDDHFQRIGYGYRLAHDLHARLDRIEGGKHFVPEDHADAVAATIRALLDTPAS